MQHGTANLHANLSNKLHLPGLKPDFVNLFNPIHSGQVYQYSNLSSTSWTNLVTVAFRNYSSKHIAYISFCKTATRQRGGGRLKNTYITPEPL